MAKEKRIEELMKEMKSFNMDKYQKSELLSEMFSLQREMVDLTFNGDHAATADLRIWDVERHLEQLNQDCGNIADDELQRFEDESKILCNLIKAEVSGARGEAKAFSTLQYIHSRNRILKNVELEDEEHRTELDAVVILPGRIVIIEVKNTSRNIFIDEKGDYYRTGEFLKWDCNIAEKVAVKEMLLRSVLNEEGVDVQIETIVVFTNNRIEVQNRFSGIKTCFVNQLAYIIDGMRGENNLTDNEMTRIETLIRNADHKEAYSFDFDVEQYKRDFATLMAVLEETSAKEDVPEVLANEAVPETRIRFRDKMKNFFHTKYAGYVGSAAAAAVVTLTSTVVFNMIKKEVF